MINRAQTWLDRWRDWAMVVLAIWLFLSPWLLGFTTAGPVADGTAGGFGIAAWNAWIFGIVVAVLALWAIFAFAEWLDWVNGAIGVWLIVAPWLLGFAAMTTAMWNHTIVGLLVLALAAWELWVVRHQSARATA